jgi:hypothetical protein
MRRTIVLSAVLVIAASWLTTGGGVWAQQTGTAPGAAPAAPRNNAQTERMLRLLRAGIQQDDQQLRGLAERMPRLADDIRRLHEEVQAIQPADKPEPPKPNAVPVKYRPPMEHFTDKQELNFICEEGRISFVDFTAINKHIKTLKPAGAVAFDLPDSDFRIEGTASPGHVKLTVVRKLGCPGETWDEAQRPGSRFLKLLSTKPPGKYYLVFSVWPDSYDVFREARLAGWNRRYDINWFPMSSTEKMTLTSGAGGPGITQ